MTAHPGADARQRRRHRHEGMHPDQHALVFDPFNTRFFFVGSDGGVVRANDRYRFDKSPHQPGAIDQTATKGPTSPLPPVLAGRSRPDRLPQRLARSDLQSVVSSTHPNARATCSGGTQDNGTWRAHDRAPTSLRVGRRRRRPSAVRPRRTRRSLPHVLRPRRWTRTSGRTGVRHRLARGLGLPSSSSRWTDAAADETNPEAFSFYVPLIEGPEGRGDALFTGGEFRVAHARTTAWRTAPSSTRTATSWRFDCGSIQCGDWQHIGTNTG